MSGAFPLAGNLALEVVSMAAVAFMVAADIGDRMQACVESAENSRMEGTTMLRNIWVLAQIEREKFIRLGKFILLALSLAYSLVPTSAQQPGQRIFASVEDAGRALFTAMQSPDDHALLGILGPAGSDVVSSGDPIEDLDARTSFHAKYEEMHRFVTEPNGTVTLVVGAENWPLPIPLIKKNGAWYFDTLAGKDEILFRRVGKNEMAAMQGCSDLLDAQKQYYSRAPNGFAREYAQK